MPPKRKVAAKVANGNASEKADEMKVEEVEAMDSKDLEKGESESAVVAGKKSAKAKVAAKEKPVKKVEEKSTDEDFEEEESAKPVSKPALKRGKKAVAKKEVHYNLANQN